MCSTQDMLTISVITCTKILTEKYVLPLILYIVFVSLHLDMLYQLKQHFCNHHRRKSVSGPLQPFEDQCSQPKPIKNFLSLALAKALNIPAHPLSFEKWQEKCFLTSQEQQELISKHNEKVKCYSNAGNENTTLLINVLSEFSLEYLILSGGTSSASQKVYTVLLSLDLLPSQ